MISSLKKIFFKIEKIFFKIEKMFLTFSMKVLKLLYSASRAVSILTSTCLNASRVAG